MIGNRIKKYRAMANISQRELADRIGMSQQQLSQYELGVRHPKPETVNRIANALGVSYDALIPGITFEAMEYSEVCITKQAYDLLVGAFHLYGYEFPVDAKGIVIKVC